MHAQQQQQQRREDRDIHRDKNAAEPESLCYGLGELLAGWSLLRFDCVRVMHNTSSPKTYTHNWKLLLVLLLSWRRLD
jgi:hypothetical protein